MLQYKNCETRTLTIQTHKVLWLLLVFNRAESAELMPANHTWPVVNMTNTITWHTHTLSLSLYVMVTSYNHYIYITPSLQAQ